MRRTLFLLVILFFGSNLVHAAEIKLYFSGFVTSTDANGVAISEVGVGDEVQGAFSFNSDGKDQMGSDPNAGLYGADSLTLSVDGFHFTSEGGRISVTNNGRLIPGQPALDVFEVVSPLRGVSGPSLSGLPPVQIDLVIVDKDASVFSNDSLPASLDIRQFEIVSEKPFGTTGGRAVFQSLSSGGIGEIRFEIKTLSAEK